jgi:hypothetical protein
MGVKEQGKSHAKTPRRKGRGIVAKDRKENAKI